MLEHLGCNYELDKENVRESKNCSKSYNRNEFDHISRLESKREKIKNWWMILVGCKLFLGFAFELFSGYFSLDKNEMQKEKIFFNTTINNDRINNFKLFNLFLYWNKFHSPLISSHHSKCIYELQNVRKVTFS